MVRPRLWHTSDLRGHLPHRRTLRSAPEVKARIDKHGQSMTKANAEIELLRALVSEAENGGEEGEHEWDEGLSQF